VKPWLASSSDAFSSRHPASTSTENALGISCCDRRNLDPLVGCRIRVRRIQQLLLAQSNRLQAFRGDLEGGHQNIANSVRPSLTEGEIEVAPTSRGGVAYNQEFVSEQSGITERIGDTPERAIGIGPNDRRVFIELNIDDEPRQVKQCGRDRRPLRRYRIGLRFNSGSNLLPQGGHINIRKALESDELVDPAFTRLGRLRLNLSLKLSLNLKLNLNLRFWLNLSSSDLGSSGRRQEPGQYKQQRTEIATTL